MTQQSFLITGATGFIGTHLCNRLTADGHKVYALVRNPQKAASLPKKGIEFIKGDLSLFKDKKLKLPQVDYVLHIAGIVAAKNVQGYFDINTQATIDLVECLKRQSWKPKRMLHASSLAAAGPCLDGKPKNEKSPNNPIEPYGQSKLAAEEYLNQNTPFPVTNFRPGIVMGPHDPAMLTLFKMAHYRFGFKVMGLDAGISFIHVDDLIEAIVAMSFDVSNKHKTYFAVYDEVIKTSAIWKSLKKATGKRLFMLSVPQPLLYLLMLGSTALSKIIPYTNQLDIKQYKQITAKAYSCTSKALRDDLGWQPKHNVEEAVKKTYQGYREIGWI
ncbi:NAD(P)-dependent oxidoreductase [bacterium]|nr:NAD(P)-dependent oxidoreductase [bacterium]